MPSRTELHERLSHPVSSTTKLKETTEYGEMKTPGAVNTDVETGALRGGGAPRLLSRESFGLFAQYWTVGFVYGTLPGTAYPFLQVYKEARHCQRVY